MVIQRTHVVSWNVSSKIFVDICPKNYRFFVEIFDLRDTKMKMNLIDEKSFSHVRNIIQGWKSATNSLVTNFRKRIINDPEVY